MRNFDRINLSDLKTHFEQWDVEIYIGFSSFENRCLSVANHISTQKMYRALIAYFDEDNVVAEKNLKKLSDIFESQDASVSQIKHDKVNPFIGADTFFSALDTIPSEIKNVLIDITTFSRESLLILLQLIRTKFSKRFDIRFIYNSAKDYDPGKPIKDKRLSAGIEEIRSVLGYPGVFKPSRKIHLIVMVGFEIERVEKIIQAYEPALLSLGISSHADSMTSEIYEENREILSELLNKYSDTNSFEFSGKDLCEAKEKLLKVFNPEYNNVVVPMNTKISALAAGMAAFERQEIQIAYAQPSYYNYDNYSIASDDCYIFKIAEL